MNVIDKHKYQLQEFRFSPVGLSPYTKIDMFSDIPPIEIYSSPNIESRAINQFNESSITKPIINTIQNAINNKKIIIGYTNPSKFKFLYNKIKFSFGIKKNYALGLYDQHDDTIYIVLDDNVYITGNTKYSITETLVHELCHMAAKHYNKTNYLKNVKNDYDTFYSNFLYNLIYNEYQLLLKDEVKDIINKNKKYLFNFIIRMHKLYDANENKNFSLDLNPAKKEWFILLHILFNNVIDVEKLYEISKNIINLYKYNFLNDKSTNNDEIKKIHNSIKYGYKSLGLNNITTLTGQEVLFLSEVICIYNQNGLHNNIIKSINKINMG